jgi:hypothetical protein
LSQAGDEVAVFLFVVSCAMEAAPVCVVRVSRFKLGEVGGIEFVEFAHLLTLRCGVVIVADEAAVSVLESLSMLFILLAVRV